MEIRNLLKGEENKLNHYNDLNNQSKNKKNNLLNKITEIKIKENLINFDSLGKLNELGKYKFSLQSQSKSQSQIKSISESEYLNTGK
jgi:hypothetical protein